MSVFEYLNPFQNFLNIHLWFEIEKMIRQAHISSAKDLKEAIINAWYSISTKTCENLVFSMPNRTVKKAK